MSDVIVRLFKRGKLIRKSGGGSTDDEACAVLGRAMIGHMKLGVA